VYKRQVFLPDHPASENDSSLTLLATFGNDRILLPGDLEQSGIAELNAKTPATPITVLKLPHHGSRNSTPGLLLDHFPAKMAVVSVGADNRFGFPHLETVDALNSRQIPLFRTDLDGTVRFVTQGNEWRAERWKDGEFH